MSIKSIIICGLSFLLVHTLHAQATCAFDAVHAKRINTDPGYKKQVDDLEKKIALKTIGPNRPQTEQISTAIYTIPVVIHVIHTGDAIGTIYNPTDAQLVATIDYLNSIYDGSYPGIGGVGDIQIQFVLAKRDPQCNPTTGINRINGAATLTRYNARGVNVQNSNGESELDVKNLSRWDPKQYYNIWVVNRFDGSDGTSGTFVGGFAYFPGAPVSIDGTMLLATQMQPAKKTLPHEMGHAFGVYHPFQGGSTTVCPTNGNCATEGDRVCDTDPITQSFDCRTGTNSCTGTPYDANTENNFMGYSSCASLFTAGQKLRMLSAASSARVYTGGYTLSSTYPLASYSAPAASCSPATSSLGLSGIYAGVLKLALNGTSVSSGTSYSDAGYRDNASSCHSLFVLQQGLPYTLDLTLYGLNGEQAMVWIDYNNDNIFDNSNELLIAYAENTAPGVARPNGVVVNVPFTVPSNAVKDRVLRMRVLEDLSTMYGAPALTGACSAPDYGQAEDYGVVIQSQAALPVKVTSFRGLYDGFGVDLKWETSSEQNGTNFDVERSMDGIQFKRIGSVQTKGAANVFATYEFTDRDVSAGSYYYRLRHIDMDSRYDFSRIIKIIIHNPKGSFRLVNNPASEYLDIQLSPLTSVGEGQVADINGRILMNFRIPANTPRHKVRGISNLSPGLYFLEVHNSDFHHVLKFIKN